MFDLLDSSFHTLRHAVDSPWIWLIIFVIVAGNAVIPFLPSRSAVVAVATLSLTHPAVLVVLMVVTAISALTGDCLGYWVGGHADRGMLARLLRGDRGRRRYQWARGMAYRHAPMLIIAGRHLPGGRMVGALAPGSVAYPLRRFVALDAFGSSIWSAYCIGVGYLGGAAAANDPATALLLGFGIALIVPGVMELVRRRSAHRGSAPTRHPSDDETTLLEPERRSDDSSP